MKAFHLLGAAPLYTNSFVLISEAGHAVVIDPAAEVQETIKFSKRTTRRSPPSSAPTATMTMWQCRGAEPGVEGQNLL